MKKTSLIFGILAIVAMLGSFGWYFGYSLLTYIFIVLNPLFVIIGLITGFKEISRSPKGESNGNAIAGIVLSMFALVVWIITIILLTKVRNFF